jgi:hypothetical protein
MSRRTIVQGDSREGRNFIGRDSTPPPTPKIGDCGSCTSLFSNRIYVFVTFGISFLYFVLAGLQFWTTDYLIKECQGNSLNVMILYLVTSIVAPLGGLKVGELIDSKLRRMDESLRITRTLVVLIGIDLLSVAFVVPAGYSLDPYVFVVLVFIGLFCGAGILPSATNVCISSVEPEQRQVASSVSVTMFNLIGYFGAPFITSLVMQSSGSYTVGIQVCLLTSFVTTACFIVAWDYSRGLVSPSKNYKGEEFELRSLRSSDDGMKGVDEYGDDALDSMYMDDVELAPIDL